MLHDEASVLLGKYLFGSLFGIIAIGLIYAGIQVLWHIVIKGEPWDDSSKNKLTDQEKSINSLTETPSSSIDDNPCNGCTQGGCVIDLYGEIRVCQHRGAMLRRMGQGPDEYNPDI